MLYFLGLLLPVYLAASTVTRFGVALRNWQTVTWMGIKELLTRGRTIMTSRSYLITLNNYGRHLRLENEHKALSREEWGELFDIKFQNNGVRYCILQQEVGEQGTHHLQGYVEFCKPQRLSRCKNIFSNQVHCEKRRGTRNQAKCYCSKQDSRLPNSLTYEWGEWRNGGQGKRNDLAEVRTMLEEGKSLIDVAQFDFSVYLKYERNLAKYQMLIQESRSWEMVNEIHWGKSGAGKTRFVYDRFDAKDIYVVPQPNNGAVWFDGYQGQDVILIDDFYGWLPLAFLLKLMDRYPMRVPIKGGFVNFTAKRIHFTSNTSMDEWYKWDDMDTELKAAFKRRITRTVYYPI